MFSGSIVAIVTPMQADGTVDYPAFEQLIDWHLENHTDGIVILGSTGEAATINPAERKKIVQWAVKHIHDRVPVIIGTGSNCTSHTIEMTREAMELGADAALIVVPYYSKPTQEGLYQHFKAVAEAVPLPQILYNVPSRTACDLLPETVLRLAKLPNIVGIKEATGDIKRVQQLRADNNEFDLLSGDDHTAMEFMLAGGNGVISVVANVAPKAFHDLCAAATKKNREAAENYNQQLAKLHQALFVESNPIPVKWALAQMGKIKNHLRLPLTPLTDQCQANVRQALQHAGIQI